MLTPEDKAIIAGGVNGRRTLLIDPQGDVTDYRAMLAREYARVGWHGYLVTPARALRGETAADVLYGSGLHGNAAGIGDIGGR